MPPEWERHDATWISWPKNPLTFPKEIIESVEEIYCQMTSALTTGETVKVLVNDEATEARASKMMEKAGAIMSKVIFQRIRSADVWIRDYGPTFLLNRLSGQKAAVRWRFNAWGGKYDDILYDDITGDDVVKASGVRFFRPGIILEGGSIDVNGVGTVLTTEQCLLNKNRNPTLSRKDIEGYLSNYISASDVIWLSSGIEGDDTDGHVDDFARFVGESKVVCAWSRSNSGNDQKVLQKNLDILTRYRTKEGAPLEIIKLPMPKPIDILEEERQLPASYANFYIGNKVVLMPAFGDDNDRKAMGMLEECFPGRDVVPIHAVDLVYGYGGIHCITQQEPASKSM